MIYIILKSSNLFSNFNQKVKQLINNLSKQTHAIIIAYKYKIKIRKRLNLKFILFNCIMVKTQALKKKN